MRRAAKIDSNQPEIVAALRKLGCSVQHTHTIGQGCPDIVIGMPEGNFWVEIKDGKKCPSQRRLNDEEAEWHSSWKGPVCIIESIDDAIAFVNGVRA